MTVTLHRRYMYEIVMLRCIGRVPLAHRGAKRWMSWQGLRATRMLQQTSVMRLPSTRPRVLISGFCRLSNRGTGNRTLQPTCRHHCPWLRWCLPQRSIYFLTPPLHLWWRFLAADVFLRTERAHDHQQNGADLIEDFVCLVVNQATGSIHEPSAV